MNWLRKAEIHLERNFKERSDVEHVYQGAGDRYIVQCTGILSDAYIARYDAQS